ncbi:hypothetical protein [Variovorax sp. dw_308]|uniref:hypothetical protein n=1 Tax=Variovorax sp. dw_308 TaxID=2721546 RepID=UPI001C459A2E|nr:hypothetical protein [Variovorax sp. dw_308]
MPPPISSPAAPPSDLSKNIESSLKEQIRDLQPALDNLVEIAGLVAQLKRLQSLVSDPALLATLRDANQTGILDQIIGIQSGVKPGGAGGTATISDFGGVLVGLYDFVPRLQYWLSTQSDIPDGDKSIISSLATGAITQVRQLLNYRPDVGAVMDDLAAMRGLQGGPADATAFHDFNVLQLAFRSVWMHAFDNNLQKLAGDLYDHANKLYAAAGQEMPDPGEIADLTQLGEFIEGLKAITGMVVPDPTGSTTAPNATLTLPPPDVVKTWFPQAVTVWPLLSDDQRNSVISWADQIANSTDFVAMQYALDAVNSIVASPQGPGARLAQLFQALSKAQSEPYAFDVFAPNSYNFGLVITYRQIWEPGPYQAGDLVSTVPLAPGETRKYTKKRIVKESVSRRTADKSTEARSTQSSEDSRCERDIMERSTTATNFKIATNGSFNIGIGSMDVSSEMGGNTGSESTQNKKDFHEATLKAAQDYRLERSLEVDTAHSFESEETFVGEISNPNNEITVTYLFYELQRRYKIREFLYRVRPVILIAQEVPSPDEINEAWLIEYQWIIARVLLDDSLRPALNYLSTGYAGDQFSVTVLQTQWKTQAALVKQLEGLVQAQLTARDSMRETLVAEQEEEDSIPEMPGILNVFTLGVDPSEPVKKMLKAHIKAGETRLKYAEQALADAQEKLGSATSIFRQATKDYSAALQNQYARQVAIDQLRIHVKQNVFYYMQAIWAHEVSDQRFFRLYKQKVLCPHVEQGCEVHPLATAVIGHVPAFNEAGVELAPVDIANTCVPTLPPDEKDVGGMLEDLSSVADLDNPLGYKGNYIIFPLLSDCPITHYMLSDFIDTYLSVKDPDGSDDFDAEAFDDAWTLAVKNHDDAKLKDLRATLEAHIEDQERRTDEIIVPTGQLFIEALPGSHPLLESFKMEHRLLDVATVRAQNRHAELENLRLASRLAADPQLLQDPDIDKRIIVDKGAGVVMDSQP